MIVAVASKNARVVGPLTDKIATANDTNTIGTRNSKSHPVSSCCGSDALFPFCASTASILAEPW